jgi:hypothetical protein
MVYGEWSSNANSHMNPSTINHIPFAKKYVSICTAESAHLPVEPFCGLIHQRGFLF